MLDEQRRRKLETWLAERFAGDAVVREARPLSGGAIQENWLLEIEVLEGPAAGHHELVLRTDAASAVAVSLTRPQEFALLRVARAAGVAVPEPLWLCEDPAVLGKSFYVMRKAAGTALGPKVVKDTSLGGDRAALAERLGGELARIHAIRPPRPELGFLGDPPTDPAAAWVAAYRGHLDALETPRPALEWGLAWCAARAPAPGEITLVHQDFRTGNYLLDGGGLTAILDWEFAGWGDPMSDLGWFCARCWRFGRPDLEAGGIAPRAPFYRGYEAVSGRRVDPAAVAFWEVAAHIRWAVIAVQQGARHTSGAERSLELALTGRLAAELELAVLQMTPPATWEAA